MVTGNYKEDVAMVAEKLLIAFSVEFIKSAPNTKRWEEAMQDCAKIAKTIVNKEYELLTLQNNESENNQCASC